ncbi:MAG: hypothetical protein KDA96_14640 [Planctomycetaceae bacterium]|nr:hypothetical protein [Planctomycetaceae bacterium]
MNCLQDETVSWYRYGDAVAEQFALSVYDLPDRLSNAAAANWIPDARTFGFSPHSIHFLPPVFFASEPRARFFDAFVVDSVDAIQFEGAAAEQYVFVPTAANEPEGSRFTVVVPLAQPRLPVRLLSEFDGIRQELSVRYAEWMSSGIYYVSERRFEHGVNGDLAFSQSAEIEMHSVNLELPSTVFNVDPDGVIPDGTLVQWANSQTAPVESELAVWRDGRIVAAGVDDVTGGYIPEPSVGRSRMILLVGINLVLVAVAMAWLRRRVKRGRGGSIS